MQGSRAPCGAPGNLGAPGNGTCCVAAFHQFTSLQSNKAHSSRLLGSESVASASGR
jgi:hypothetical protein